jgi:hypothetical protein
MSMKVSLIIFMIVAGMVLSSGHSPGEKKGVALDRMAINDGAILAFFWSLPWQ